LRTSGRAQNEESPLDGIHFQFVDKFSLGNTLTLQENLINPVKLVTLSLPT